MLTLWRKRFRAGANKHDNDFHDKGYFALFRFFLPLLLFVTSKPATDALTNFETVKYFGNEKFESIRFKESVVQYQNFSVSTQLTLSLLNGVQKFVIQAAALGCALIAGTKVHVVLSLVIICLVYLDF